ncbi:DUF742 domain-containing protein [Streptomyces sp. NBC_01411]|uniref:DUF742 domain-containing protein n=1 Tax=Streptomyces sp. NBC_01411 TaxID=2903857 RepID=UPI00324D285E
MTSGGWSDSTLGDVRPYTITGGRTRPAYALHLTTCLITRPATRPMTMNIEHESLQLLCGGAPCPVAELAARLQQPVQVVKVLISDLLDAGALVLANPAGPADPDTHLLEALLHGLRTKL